MTHPTHALPSYKAGTCCSSAYCVHGTAAEPCWGTVAVRDEIQSTDEDGNPDYDWFHACEGHRDLMEGTSYHPSDRPEDQGAKP